MSVPTLDEIREAGQNFWVVEFDYVATTPERQGEQTTRRGEITEIRGGTDIFLVDYTRDENIRRFKVANMSNLRVLRREDTEEPVTYQPRFPFVIS